ncbi:MAG: kynU, partial [Mucilaginibacter sp.]|nr:kynU [Mucilaginibacter sp.]
MIYQNTLKFAENLDARDELKHFRNDFLIPKHEGRDAIYLCGNSLGLQPVSTKKYIDAQLNSWKDLAVEGWFQGDDPWLEFHHQLKKPLVSLTGAKMEEITVMNSLTVNLHLLLVSFYQPTSKRYKILMEGGAFPSDQYAVESQVIFHGFESSDAIIELFPREGEFTLRTEDILSAIEQNANELALVLFGGVNYYTGQLFDMEAIADAAHIAGAYAGFDLAH